MMYLYNWVLVTSAARPPRRGLAACGFARTGIGSEVLP
jgi:hypothetical protein